MPAVVLPLQPPERRIWADRRDDEQTQREAAETDTAHAAHANPAQQLQLPSTGRGRDSAAAVGPLSFSASTLATFSDSSPSGSTSSASPLTLSTHSTLPLPTLAHPQAAAHWLAWAAPAVLVSSLLVAVLRRSKNDTKETREAKAPRRSDCKIEINVARDASTTTSTSTNNRSSFSPSPPVSSLRALSASPFTSSFPPSVSSVSSVPASSHDGQKYKSRSLPVVPRTPRTPRTPREASTHAPFQPPTTHTPPFSTHSTYSAYSDSNALYPPATPTAPAPTPFLQKRLRRVYHLQSPVMHDEGRMADSGSTAYDAHETLDTPRPPPLPLSTSSFAFEQPGLESSAAPAHDTATDGAAISFIHQPNPDYLGDGLGDGRGDCTSSATSSATTSDSSDLASDLVSTQAATDDEAPLSPFIGEMLAGTHHTQVFGGGVCLACLAAVNSGTIRPEDGPMYGANVPLADRRQPLK